MRRLNLWMSLLILLLCPALNARGDVTISKITYTGWADAYDITNGTVDLVFVPQIGRVMRYGYVNGPNVLWNNPALAGQTFTVSQAEQNWPNFGGDKLWNSPQSVWGWPPDPYLDSQPQAVKVLANKHLLCTGEASPTSGIRFIREISMAPSGTQVSIKNTMHATGAASVTWGIWEVFQTNAPADATLQRNLGGLFSDGYDLLSGTLPSNTRITQSALILQRDPANSYKVGSDAPGDTLRAHVQGVTLRLEAYHVVSDSYPDGGCDEEIYSNPDPLPYMEMELLGPVVTLARGATATFYTNWLLSK
jgi:hypothetical protein